MHLLHAAGRAVYRWQPAPFPPAAAAAPCSQRPAHVPSMQSLPLARPEPIFSQYAICSVTQQLSRQYPIHCKPCMMPACMWGQKCQTGCVRAFQVQGSDAAAMNGCFLPALAQALLRAQPLLRPCSPSNSGRCSCPAASRSALRPNRAASHGCARRGGDCAARLASAAATAAPRSPACTCT